MNILTALSDGAGLAVEVFTLWFFVAFILAFLVGGLLLAITALKR